MAKCLELERASVGHVIDQLEKACYVVPDTPGLGVEVNEELIKRKTFKFWQAPNLKRRDGSVTNW